MPKTPPALRKLMRQTNRRARQATRDAAGDAGQAMTAGPARRPRGNAGRNLIPTFTAGGPDARRRQPMPADRPGGRRRRPGGRPEDESPRAALIRELEDVGRPSMGAGGGWAPPRTRDLQERIRMRRPGGGGGMRLPAPVESETSPVSAGGWGGTLHTPIGPKPPGGAPGGVAMGMDAERMAIAGERAAAPPTAGGGAVRAAAPLPATPAAAAPPVVRPVPKPGAGSPTLAPPLRTAVSTPPPATMPPIAAAPPEAAPPLPVPPEAAPPGAMPEIGLPPWLQLPPGLQIPRMGVDVDPSVWRERLQRAGAAGRGGGYGL